MMGWNLKGARWECLYVFPYAAAVGQDIAVEPEKLQHYQASKGTRWKCLYVFPYATAIGQDIAVEPEKLQHYQVLPRMHITAKNKSAQTTNGALERQP